MKITTTFHDSGYVRLDYSEKKYSQCFQMHGATLISNYSHLRFGNFFIKNIKFIFFSWFPKFNIDFSKRDSRYVRFISPKFFKKIQFRLSLENCLYIFEKFSDRTILVSLET